MKTKYNPERQTWRGRSYKKGGASVQSLQASEKVSVGEYYADKDEETGQYGVFHTDKEPGFAFALFSDEAEAREDARKRNIYAAANS